MDALSVFYLQSSRGPFHYVMFVLVDEQGKVDIDVSNPVISNTFTKA